MCMFTQNRKSSECNKRNEKWKLSVSSIFSDFSSVYSIACITYFSIRLHNENSKLHKTQNAKHFLLSQRIAHTSKMCSFWKCYYSVFRRRIQCGQHSTGHKSDKTVIWIHSNTLLQLDSTFISHCSASPIDESKMEENAWQHNLSGN